MDTTLKAAREYLLNDRAWQSSGKSMDKRVNTCLVRALREIAGEVPEALLPASRHEHIRTAISGTAEAVGAYLLKTTDNKVLEIVTSAGDPWSDSATSWVPKTDRTWDGVMHLEIVDPDGRIRRRQTREWWSEVDGSDTRYYVSISTPWYDTGSNVMTVRIHQPAFFVPAETTKILSPVRIFDEADQLLGQISSGSARRDALPDYRNRVEGLPTNFWRGNFVQIPAPTEAPRVVSILENSDVNATSYLGWNGPVQEGKFRVCYTYAWGRREQEWGQSPAEFADPMWESAPSPISEIYDHAKQVDVNSKGEAVGRAAVIECSNLEEMLDFMGDSAGIQVDAVSYPPSSAPLRYGRSGVKIRIYVARDDLYASRGPASTVGDQVQATHRMNRAESDGKFYLLAEIDPLDRNSILAAMTTPSYRVSAFVWQGALPSPDPERQLRKNTGYYAYHVWPTPDSDYDLDLQVLEQPKELVNDNDQLPIKQDAFAAYLELALAYLSRLDGVDERSERKHRAEYAKLVRRFKSLHGDNNGVVENRMWGVGNSRRIYGTFNEG
ncbi:MAG: hypothetical protein P1V36_00190 [Planctomycetota bacterium]|nr:hypothetical protein [Planctomycetota bacterium]